VYCIRLKQPCTQSQSSDPQPNTPNQTGLAAVKWKWNFDFQMPLLGVGLMAPTGVAWSMLVGAVISWGVLWPVIASKAGVWYPADLGAWDGRGLFGYQICLALGLVLADGLYMLLRGLIEQIMELSGGDKKQKRRRNARRRRAARAGASGGGSSTGGGSSRRSGGRASVSSRGSSKGSIVSGGGAGAGAGGAPPSVTSGSRVASSVTSSVRRRWQAEALAAIDNDALSDASGLQFSLAAIERGLRRQVFMSDRMPGWSTGCIGTAIALLIGAAFTIPALMNYLGGPLRWWYVLTAAAAVPLVALATARAAGSTDVNLAAPLAIASVMLFAIWGGKAGGAGVALAASGLILGAAQSAAEMGYSFSAGYIAMASPTAIFIAHCVGCLAGALFAPFTYTLLLGTGDNPYAALSPLAAPARAVAAVFAAGEIAALPTYSLYAGGAAVVVGLLLAGIREAMHERVRVAVPMPVVMGVIFISGANVAGE